MDSLVKFRFVNKLDQLIVGKGEVTKYFHFTDEQVILMMFPFFPNFKIVDENQQADIAIVGVQHTDNSLLRSNEINIFLSVENTGVGRRHYQHFNKFGRCGNPVINYYLYNDYIMDTFENNVAHVAIMRILYYNSIHSQCEISNVPFESKKFCLFTSRNSLNNAKHCILGDMMKIGKVDFIHECGVDISDKSCYNSPEILRLFSQYKFVICFENSNTHGYITEKIFNVFLSGAIPIYNGAPDIENYVNKKAFIQYNGASILNKISLLSSSDVVYNRVTSEPKISPSFSSNNYEMYREKIGNMLIEKRAKELDSVFDCVAISK
jgi:hypothetical protein